MSGTEQAGRTARARERADIEEAAARLFAERGYAATSVDRIVAAAGVSKPALYRHFASKSDLHIALLERHQADLAAAALTEFAPGARERLPAMVDAWFRHVEAHPYTWRMLFQDTTGDPEVRVVHERLSRLQQAADVALLREFAPGLPEPEFAPLGALIRGSLTSLAIWWLDHPEQPRSVPVAAMLRMVDGLLLTLGQPAATARPAPRT
jgi:AcrR family transcriptional regulator